MAVARLASSSRLLIRALAGLLGLWLVGLVPAAAGSLQQLRFEHLRHESTLNQEALMVALQDQQGQMWLGTTNGLFRFDGRRARHFAADPARADSLDHPHVLSLLEAPAGRLWVGTGNGLHEIDLQRESLRRHALPGPAAGGSQPVLGLLPAPGGALWVLTHQALLRFDTTRSEARPVALPDPLRPGSGSGRLLAMASDEQGGLWLVGRGELLQLNAQEQVQRRIPVSQPLRMQPGGRSLALDGRGRLWLGTGQGVLIFDLSDGSLSDLPQRLGLPRDSLRALWRDAEGSIWLGSGNQGLWRWREGAAVAEQFRHHPALPRSLAGDDIASVYQDRSGVLWVGTWSSGISLVDLRSGGMRSYLSVPGESKSLSHPVVQAVTPDDAWHVWVGTYGGGLNRLHLFSGEVERVSLEQLPVTHVKALLRQAGMGLWVGGEQGLWLLDPLSRRGRRIELEAASGGSLSISALQLDQQGRLWAASASGLHLLHPDGRRQLLRAGPESGLGHEVVDSLLEDREGRLWVGTKGGLHLWDEASQRLLRPLRPDAVQARPEELMIYAMRQDAAGRIWLGTQLGLYELERRPGSPGGWGLRSWRELPGMPPGWIHGLQDSQGGLLWFTGAQGLTRLDPESRQLRHYPAREGNLVGGFSFGATARGVDGGLFFGGQGLLSFHPDNLRDNPVAPAVQLSDVRIYNRSVQAQDDASVGPAGPADAASSMEALGIAGPLSQLRRLRLSHREAMVSFELSALHFYARGHNRYSWRLEGFDAGWIQGTPGEGLATYTNLDPGRYRLHARAGSPDGAWGESRLLLELEVVPPWWRSTWFRSLLLLGLVLSLMAVWHLRLRVLERGRAQLARQVEQRTAEVLAQREQLEVEKRAAERGRQQIATLSEIGREITASLDLQAIQSALYRHVQALMPVQVFGVGLVRWDRRVIDFDYVMQLGRPFEPYRRSLDAPEQAATRCVLSGEPLLISDLGADNRELDARVRQQEGLGRVRLLDGSEPAAARSALYVPMRLKEQVIGVISVLSERPDAYHETDLDILATLGAYAAVALDNAEAYHRLQLTQAQLVEQEKLASLGALVAGVAHELNTPIGNSLLVASTLQESSRRFLERSQSGSLRRSELEQFCGSSAESSELLVRSLGRAAQLVSSFKQLAVDQTSEQRRSFDLAKVCAELALTLDNRLRREEHSLELSVPEGLVFDSFPGPLEQVLSNLMLNAMLHGFEGRRGGRMHLSAEALGSDRVRLLFSDDGRGIAPELLPRIFDPFFTTKMGKGGSGLGLHICYTIVHSLLGGQITASSVPGQGTRFELLLPRVAPPSPAGPGALAAPGGLA
ncbi:MAG: two-component regulator propeller domain-containing protein [Roseateles sp.]